MKLEHPSGARASVARSGAERSRFGLLAGGMLALLLAMGVGRFAYTALLPQMHEQGWLTVHEGALLAAANYLGYLLGAVWAALSRRADPSRRLWIGLAASVSTTWLMGAMGRLDLGLAVWCAVRGVAGVASAFVYVYSTGIVLRRLAELGAASWSGVHYLGVGAGIALSALVAQFMLGHGSAAQAWYGLGGVAALAALVSARQLVPAGRRALSMHESVAIDRGAAAARPLTWLALAYGLAGFGYIVNMTFLPLMLRGGEGADSAMGGWLLVGLAAMPATVLWMRLAVRWGSYPALIACTLLQAVGVALPVLVAGVPAAMAGAVLLGGTFMGIAGLAQGLARVPDPERSARRIGLITALYGGGQIAGPALVAVLGRGEDFRIAVLAAAAALLASAALFEVSRRVERLG